MADRIQAVVIGAGVIGLACARSLAKLGKEVVIVERASCIGSGTSSRNSEVIHAGIYYPRDSLKSKLCRNGRDSLYRYCHERSIPHSKIGKILVSTSDPRHGEGAVTLEKIKINATQNGVTDLRSLSSEDVRYLEPEVVAEGGGLFSPSTGIVDSHSFMVSLLAEAEENGAAVAYNSAVCGGHPSDDGIALRIRDMSGGDEMDVICDVVVNCAGLSADGIANLILKEERTEKKKHVFAKGNYFRLQGQSSPFSHLVYPLPEAGGLGVHATLDLGGFCRFGPDVEWMDPIIDTQKSMQDWEFDYTVDPKRADLFYEEIRKYWPGLKDGVLIPDYSGIRPKAVESQSLDIIADFVIEGPRDHGVPGFVNMMGMESPGLTSSLAIADYAMDLLKDNNNT